MKENEIKTNKAKTLIKSGAIMSGVGTLTTTSAILLQHGELGPVGLLIGAAGVTMMLTGKRRNKM